MAERFEFPFKENYAEIDGVRLHYVDEGTGPPDRNGPRPADVELPVP
jgi:hypothetical protein